MLIKRFRPLLLLLLLLLLGLAGIWQIARSAARELDNASNHMIQQGLELELQQQRRQLATTLADYAVWNDMAVHLNALQPDIAWLNDNLTSSIYHNLGVQLALLIDKERGVLLGRRHGILAPQPSQLLPLAPAQWQALLRNADRYAAANQYGQPFSQLIQYNALNLQTGQPESRLLMLSLQRISPENPQQPVGPIPRYLLFARHLDSELQQQIANTYGLSSLSLNFGQVNPELKEVLPLKDSSGQTLAYLSWPAQSPGQALLQRVLPQSLLLLIMMLLLGLLVIRTAMGSQRRQQQLAERKQQQGQTLQQLISLRRDDQQELEDYLSEVLPLVAQALHISRVSVWQFSSDQKEMQCLAGINTLTGERLGGEILDESHHGDYLQAMLATGMLASNKIEDDPRLQSLQHYLYARGVTALLDIAIMVGGMHHGILCVESQTPRREWLQDEIDFVSAAANIIALVMEARARLHAEGELYRQFYYDRFTGLPNRIRLLMQLDELLQQRQHSSQRDAQPVGCVMLSVEGLANINELFGRDNGDLVIRELGRRLEGSIGNGEMVARCADNRFALQLLGNDEEQLSRRVDDITTQLAKPLEVQGQPLFLRLSVGLAIYPHDCDEAEAILENAEAALLLSRESPGSWVRFHPEINSNWRRRNRLQADLRQAAPRGELLLNYQPYVSLKTGKVAGAEALVRWQHPELGLISPVDFIPLAEETGVIHALGEWVLQEGIRHAVQWREQYLSNFVISINVSLLQLEDPRFAEVVAVILATHHLPGEALELEVTEGLALRNTPAIDSNLQQLRAQGIAIAIDDFGTGYASFSYLRRFPVEKLKIDKQFLDLVPENESSSNLVRMIVAMGHTLGASVTGEGIENIQQARFLAQHGCDYAQGYLISRPLPGSALEQFLAEAKPLPL
ncbi:EAL domain-containing protein [Vogesella sp. LIG4]|uniref:bifunctional diguanylate cyclase/phosphodiesterase n=1 Tax=Vogesella sp. LIG4 TaxID=1192162 RepID=UPI00081FD229|nr:EAL domain-containing protein [Vogesella sp. LIG4]SCK11046.1 diguanylate cyclase (GGDEF) domain-containing protein [Vogesella sp. LIG4]